jgi:hypothetical protein
VHVDPHYAPQAQASEVGHSKKHRGRENLRKQEEPAPGFRRVDVARLAARHRSRKGEGVTRKKRKEIEVSVPARIARARVWLLARREQLQKSVGDVWSRISSANALQKERSGSSERGPSSARGPAGETVGSHVERNVRRESASPLETGEDRRKAQGGERSSSSGSHIAKSGGGVAGPGL